MSELHRFLPEDQDLLVGLPYRVGMWMSGIDDTDLGTQSEEQEAAKLRSVLQSLAGSKKSVLLADIATEALRQTSNWPRWASMTETVLEDVSSAKRVLKGQATQEEFNAFAKALMLVGTAVARAVREDNDMVEEKSYLGWLSDKVNDITMALTDREAHKDMNISPAEDTALNELLDTLKA